MNNLIPNSPAASKPWRRRWLLRVVLVGLSVAIQGCTNVGTADFGAGEASKADKEQAVNAVLDNLHAQAAAANYTEYFALYADNAVFLGTDRTEYWPLAEFKAYSKPRFNEGGGWTYTPLTRQLHFFENTAWFEEELRSASYGQVRGTGVLIRTNSGWKVAQYNLTLPIPNEVFGDIATDIKHYYESKE